MRHSVTLRSSLVTRPKGARGGLVGSKRYIYDVTIGSESSLSLALSAFCFLYLSLSLSVVLSLALSFCGHPRPSKWSSKAPIAKAEQVVIHGSYCQAASSTDADVLR